MKKRHEFTLPPTQATHMKKRINWIMWGYVTGGVLCFIGLIILSIALGQALRTTTRGFLPVTLPGANALTIKTPGLYIGLYQHSGKTPVPVQELSTLNVVVSDTETGSYLPVQQGPGAQMFTAGSNQGAVLFQFEAPSAGKYLLDATYPSGRGPSINAFLIHESLQNNRPDIAVGVILCLVFGGFGAYVLIRTRKAVVKLLLAEAPSKSKTK